MEAAVGYMGAQQAIGATADGDVVLRTGNIHHPSGKPLTLVDGVSAPNYPFGYNVKPSNLRKFRAAVGNIRAGSGNARILHIGDSTTMGEGSNATQNLRRVNSYPARLAGLLAGVGLPSSHEGFFGCGRAAAGNSLPAYDSRATFGGGWTYSGAFVSVGGPMLTTVAAGTFSFTPATNCDTFDIWYVRNPGNGTFTVNLDGGSTLATVNTNGATAVLKQTVTGSLGAHVLNLVQSSGTIFVVGIECYDSTKKQVIQMNGGYWGALMSDWVAGTVAYSPLNVIPTLAPDLVIINLGINDWKSDIGLASFSSNYQSLITACLASSDVILMVGAPSAITFQPRSVQDAYVAAIYDLATANDLPLVDITSRWSSYEVSSAVGLYFDTLHPNGPGYSDIASLVKGALTAYV